MPFQDAYERILQSTGLRTQTDVAALLGVKQSSISDAKRRRPAVCGGNGYTPDACFVGTAGGREP